MEADVGEEEEEGAYRMWRPMGEGGGGGGIQNVNMEADVVEEEEEGAYRMWRPMGEGGGGGGIQNVNMEAYGGGRRGNTECEHGGRWGEEGGDRM
ncbi:hypothetical protein BaRGS_00040391 [Batillaria attramentaria]|uniref:Uncharacterized protein n=1 Tax=Batillaria attramentaria TaxID=370345 RepID=A0ABD0J0A4_9CAEN